MATLKTGWIKKLINGVSEKIFAISHVKSVFYNYAEKKTLADKLDSMDKEIDTAKKSWRGIQNNLTSTSTTDSLSAYQGKVLNDKIDGLSGKWYGEVTTIDNSNITIWASTAIVVIECGNVNSFGFVYERNGSINIIWGWNNLNLTTNSSTTGLTLTGMPAWSRISVMDMCGGGINITK